MANYVLNKMNVENASPAQYSLKNSEGESILFSDLIGKVINITFLNQIFCSSCGAKTKKSFGGGFCYSCFTNAPEASPCIIFPEKCKAHLNEGRDIQWELDHHLQPHVVYLASTSKIKVGVTRETQMPTRWLDQGADAAVVLAKVPNRHIAGIIEVYLKKHFSDKTSWQQMLQSDVFDEKELLAAWEKAISVLPSELVTYCVDLPKIQKFKYPFKPKLAKLKQINLDKTESYSGKLDAIKGQYLLFEDGVVFNVRKHTGYLVEIQS